MFVLRFRAGVEIIERRKYLKPSISLIPKFSYPFLVALIGIPEYFGRNYLRYKYYNYFMIAINNNIEVFEKMAKRYIREDSHWGSDLDIIKMSIEELLDKPFYKKHGIRWLDIGCGPAYHTTNIGELYPEIEIVGIDYSPSMLREAQERIDMKKLDNITLKNADVIKEEFYTRFNLKYSLITFLNNGLGNLYKNGNENPARIRKNIFKKINKSLEPDGFFIISVYNKEKLNIDNEYGRNIAVIRELSNQEKGDFFCEYNIEGKRIPYYTHWFSETELHELSEETDLKLDFLERRMSRFLVRYEKDMEKAEKQRFFKDKICPEYLMKSDSYTGASFVLHRPDISLSLKNEYPICSRIHIKLFDLKSAKNVAKKCKGMFDSCQIYGKEKDE